MWGAQFVSNTGGWMQTVAAQWLMLTLTSSATYVALVQTAAGLPVVLFALLAGYVASFIGGRPHFNAAWIAGGLVALTAVAIMMTKVVAWPQMVQLFFMAPAVVVGGWTYVLRRRAKTDGDSQ